jgi:hypothetical protein
MLIVMCKFVIWVVSSVGRASPLQGEGHWFKSSTTHHSLNGAYYKISKWVISSVRKREHHRYLQVTARFTG